MRVIDFYARRCVAWPLAILGLLLTWISEGLIRTAAWLADVDPQNDEQSL
jgi:hypothetical protein